MINGLHDEFFRVHLARDAWARFDRIGHYEIPHGHISACAATRTLKRALLTALRDHRIITQ